LSRTKRSTKFGQGWRQFNVENQLKEGDRFVFEVDHAEKKPIVEVYINQCNCDVAECINLV